MKNLIFQQVVNVNRGNFNQYGSVSSGPNGPIEANFYFNMVQDPQNNNNQGNFSQNNKCVFGSSNITSNPHALEFLQTVIILNR